ncbi:hypothetical protein P5673_031597 [Acropora cervicornis]|uniref:Uncharacterized protein n=1 Tax=Acropora cervicornis TaxID=6130 RepID=A0AAD9USR2_ACRCE|nr:hypothetical protein P5673_031597 [Acropora cervicornis]
MEGCMSTVQVTPPMETKPPFSQHILWAPKKKRLHRRVVADTPSRARINKHSKIRKRLIFPCLEGSERKEEEEKLSDMPEDIEKLDNAEKIGARTPNISKDKLRCGVNDLHLGVSNATNLRVQQFRANQKSVENADPPRTKRKLALSSFR